MAGLFATKFKNLNIMGNLLLQIIWMLSLGVIVYLVAIAVPRIDNKDINQSKVWRLWNSHYATKLERIDLAIVDYKDKLLRRLKVILMKADNFVSRRLNKNKEKI